MIETPQSISDWSVEVFPTLTEGAQNIKLFEEVLEFFKAKIEGEEINAELEARLKKTQELELELRKENAKLKELLKEVNDYLPEFEIPMNILAKIDEALK